VTRRFVKTGNIPPTVKKNKFGSNILPRGMLHYYYASQTVEILEPGFESGEGFLRLVLVGRGELHPPAPSVLGIHSPYPTSPTKKMKSLLRSQKERLAGCQNEVFERGEKKTEVDEPWKRLGMLGLLTCTALGAVRCKCREDKLRSLSRNDKTASRKRS
jgi:hypothetical protein